VIAPIGDDGTETRRRSDQVLKHIIAPAAKDCGYETMRADKISEPGIITSQVIQHLVEDALVIADLTGRNPNVFYELAIRHVVRKPVVQVIQVGESIPFDVAATRTIQVDHRDLDSAARCREELVKQIHAAEKDPKDVDTPISVAIDLQSLRRSDNPLEKSNAEIISMLQELKSSMNDLSERTGRGRINPGMIEEFAVFYDRLASVLELSDGEKMNRARLGEARHAMHRMERMLHMLAMESGMPSDLIEHILERRIRRKKLE
jgi:hypothetical protein